MPIILNKEKLATNQPRKNALEILGTGLEAIQTEKILKEKLRVENGILYIEGEKTAKLSSPSQGEACPPVAFGRRLGGELNLKSFNKIILVAIGKCALDGAKVVEEILGDYITQGAVIDVREAADAKALASRGKIKYYQGTHPLPSEQNISATKEILEMTKNLTENDLVICLISGGGSSLFELPAEGFTLDDIILRTKEATARGADIYELNEARKKMSQVKGGKFAKHCFPAKIVSLIFSDVLGNDISIIASGPTVWDRATNILICSNHDALLAMKIKAEELGFNAKIETETLSGNAAEIGKQLAEKNIGPKTCLLFGGETTVKLAKPAPALATAGEGGRNQELALSALTNISDDRIIISAASDGWDNTDHAGALVDKELLNEARQMGLSPEEFLKNSDSYNFLKQVGGAISTGRLGSNVSDLVIILRNGKTE